MAHKAEERNFAPRTQTSTGKAEAANRLGGGGGGGAPHCGHRAKTQEAFAGSSAQTDLKHRHARKRSTRWKKPPSLTGDAETAEKLWDEGVELEKDTRSRPSAFRPAGYSQAERRSRCNTKWAEFQKAAKATSAPRDRMGPRQRFRNTDNSTPINAATIRQNRAYLQAAPRVPESVKTD